MNSESLLGKLLLSFGSYYTVSTEGIEGPFSAQAIFKSHTEQYFLVKSAKLSDIDSNEIVFFYNTDTSLELEDIEKLSQSAWESGLSNVAPYYGHKNTDISLIILASNLSSECLKGIKKIKRYKSYKFGLYGWSHFKIIAADFSSLKIAFNRFGECYKKTLLSILKA